VRKWLTVQEVSEGLSVDPSTVRRWIRQGQLKAKRFGGVVRIDPAEVEK